MTGQVFQIYGLYHPITRELRYIGKAKDAQKRLKGHIRTARRYKFPVCNWINTLIAAELCPKVEVLSVTDGGPGLKNTREQCRAAGNASASRTRLLHADPEWKRSWELKRRVMTEISKNYINNRRRALLRGAAARVPVFACFASIKDREEDSNGNPVLGAA